MSGIVFRANKVQKQQKLQKLQKLLINHVHSLRIFMKSRT